MLVGRDTFESTLAVLAKHPTLSLDTETTGLRPYHGDRLFSLILGHEDSEGKPVAYYFNFWPSYPDFPANHVLTREHLSRINEVLFKDASKSWILSGASYDQHMLNAEGMELAGPTWCTVVQGRVEYNEHFEYGLGASLERIGLKKDGGPEKWIEENNAWEWQTIPGKKTRVKNKFYFKVPPSIIVPYGLDDAKGTLSLGRHQVHRIAEQAKEFPAGVPNLCDAARIEQRLAKTVFRMERAGFKIDRPYVVRATRYEADRLEKATQGFRRETGRDYSASPKLFEDIFASEKGKWKYTEKGNPSFESDTLKTFENPAAKSVLLARDSKSKLDFYNGFLYHADADDVIHGNFKSGGTRTFRFSSADPNLQNMTSEETSFCRPCKEWFEEMVNTCPNCQGTDIEHPEFIVRRSFVPRPGNALILADFRSMEYAVMLDYAKHMMIQYFKSRGQSWDEGYFEIANKVGGGFDVHKATAELMGVTRKYAKTLNFMLLYGGGPAKLAEALGLTLDDAIALRNKYFRALPYVGFMIEQIVTAIKQRGWIRNWAGYKYHFPNREFAYTGPNTIIQGGCAAIVKTAMNSVDEYLQGKEAALILSVHDELVVECPEKDAPQVARVVKELMEKAYPHRYVPLAADVDYSTVSLADKQKMVLG